MRRAGPPVVGPEPVGDDGVDKAGEEGGVDEVGNELGPLGDGGDACSGDGEGPLVEEVAVVGGGGGDALEAEVVLGDEGVEGAAEGSLVLYIEFGAKSRQTINFSFIT
ncbi:hypothetical protein MRB53_005689 [Persea americana]|uniref:Uncharacterized protein n=1 Tax=Persea americana TaxID=3435 RepID=A0ACC2MEY3_PERAE|nr:hypothetical protein MRB53_005689 [Persea americana]